MEIINHETFELELKARDQDAAKSKIESLCSRFEITGKIRH
jgi:uncharacterized protein YjbK